nr:polysaccharide deacetylase family protein [uncultured Allomuricauda sp.]
MQTNCGKLVISLDFELFWGVRDKRSLDTYGQNLLNVHKVLPVMLDKFNDFGVKATFATVGFLFASNWDELMEYLPKNTPKYLEENLSPYPSLEDLNTLKTNTDKRFFFAQNWIQSLADEGIHEIGTHTFSHYYCLEEGQDKLAFKDDLQAAIKIASDMGLNTKSIVFPRNQVNQEYLELCLQHGITSYRGTEKIWFNRAESELKTSLIKRIFRTLDCYFNLSGHNTFAIEPSQQQRVVNIPSSRFLRPYNKRFKALESFKLNRIKRSMTHAAKNNELFHLWWHPHNYGSNLEENFAFLDDILKHFSHLEKEYGFKSYTMSQAAEESFSKTV